MWNVRGSVEMRDQSRNLPVGLERRLQARTLTANDLERAFQPPKKEIDKISLPSSTGFATFIFGLEGGLLDMDALYYQAYVILASSSNLAIPSKAAVRDTIGSSFRETKLAFGWNLPDEFEDVFVSTMEKLMKKEVMGNKMTIQPGAVLALERCIRGGNTIIVNTALPRRLATKALGITQLSSLLAANVNPENLIHPAEDGDGDGDKQKEIGRGRPGSSARAVDGRWPLIQACAQARTSPILGMLVDTNHRNLLQAKRVGLCTLGVRGYSLHASTLNSCDKVLPSASLVDFRLEECYAIIRRHAELASGMKEMTNSVNAMLPPTSMRQQVAAPAEDDPRAIRDTFADDERSPDVL